MTASSSRSEPRRRWAPGWPVLLGALLGVLTSVGVGEFGRRFVFDSWQQAAPRTITHDDVAVVLIDSLSLDAVGPWPWPRYYLARLVEEIAAQQPKAIAFDMIFAEPDALNPDNFAALYPEMPEPAAAQVRALSTLDSEFATVIGKTPVVLPRLGIDRNGVDPAGILVEELVGGRPPAGALSYDQVITSITELDDVALGHAVINGPPDDDGLIRSVPLTATVGGRVMPGLALELARIASGEDKVAWRGQGVQLGQRWLPANKQGRLLLRLARFPGRAAYSAAEVLREEGPPPGAFAGKVVLIGLGAEGTQDIVATPLQSELFGVFIQAQAVDAILHRGWLARPGWLAFSEWAAGAVLVLVLLAAGLTGRKRLLLAALVLAILLPLLSLLAFDRANLLFDPLRPILIGGGAGVALYLAAFLRSRAERARLSAELTEQRVAAAVQEGELIAARRIQLGMVPSPIRLAGLDPRVEFGAVLKPARSVGGDFYDALMLGPDRLLFVVGDVTGKGVPAALYMALSKALTKSVLSRASGDLGAAVQALNRDLLREADEEMGVSMLIGVLDCPSGALSLVNAGHENPIAVRADGTIETLELAGGPPFCVVEFPYPAEQAALGRGDTLVLITDGVTEAQDAAGTLFGIENTRAALTREATAVELVDHLASTVRGFEGETEPSDDVTIVAIRWRGPSA